MLCAVLIMIAHCVAARQRAAISKTTSTRTHLMIAWSASTSGMPVHGAL
jgi:hypothetical protein